MNSKTTNNHKIVKNNLQNTQIQNIKKKNLDFMISLNQNERKNIIRNTRFRNNSKYSKEDPNNPTRVNEEIKYFENFNFSEVKIKGSHLEKVKDSERILKMLQTLPNIPLNPNEIKYLIPIIQNGDYLSKHKAIIKLRLLLSVKKNTPIQIVIDNNGIPILIETTKNNSELHMVFEATWCLANLCSGEKYETKYLLNKNIIDVFANLLDHKHDEIKEQAIWGIGNLIGDSPEVRDQIISQNVIQKLISLFKSQKNSSELVNILIWCFSNCFRIKPKIEENNIINELLKTLIFGFYYYDDFELRSDCLLGLKQYCKEELIPFFTHDSFLSTLKVFYKQLVEIKMNRKKIFELMTGVHVILGNITNSDDKNTDKILEHGFLSLLSETILINNILSRREICWILSNVSAGTSEQITRVLNEPNLFGNLVSLLNDDSSKVRLEALWCICNITKDCSSEQLMFLVNNNILDLFSDLITREDCSKMKILMLEATERMLIKSEIGEFHQRILEIAYSNGLAEKIEALQKHESEIVYEKSRDLLEAFFDLKEY
jgi:hypothetical protein